MEAVAHEVQIALNGLIGNLEFPTQLLAVHWALVHQEIMQTLHSL
jgi:hypothetical protein